MKRRQTTRWNPSYLRRRRLTNAERPWWMLSRLEPNPRSIGSAVCVKIAGLRAMSRKSIISWSVLKPIMLRFTANFVWNHPYYFPTLLSGRELDYPKRTSASQGSCTLPHTARRYDRRSTIVSRSIFLLVSVNANNVAWPRLARFRNQRLRNYPQKPPDVFGTAPSDTVLQTL